MKNFPLRCAMILVVLPVSIAVAADAPATPPNQKYTCGVFVQTYVFTQYVTLKDGESVGSILLTFASDEIVHGAAPVFLSCDIK